ncbi:MAG TPA: hypothetical protein VGL20_07500 [Candidatus Dormibacteraeota bacterium]|jgi:hypothetical protein
MAAAPAPPPGALVSPDGRYWWDGNVWAPVVAAAPPEPPPHQPGFWERHRLHVAEKRYEAQRAEWQGHVDGLEEYLRLIRGFAGDGAAGGLVLKRGETIFGRVEGASLVETRVQGGHWASASSGFSLPVGSIGGRSIRYHVGRSRGHYVQGSPVPTAIDRGTMAITSQRVVFVGARQTRECAFAKLVGYRHDGGELTLSVTNRQNPTTIHYGPELDAWFVERFELALAHFRGTVAQLDSQVAGLLVEAASHRPEPPAGGAV